MLNIKRVAKILLIFALTAILFSCEQKKKTQHDEPKPEAKKKATKPAKDLPIAPDFTLNKTTRDATLSLSDYAGKVVLLDFWATWCGPCKSSIPNLNNLRNKYSDKGFEIIGVNLDRISNMQDEGKVLQFVKDFAIQYPVVYGETRMRNMYGGVPSIPTMILITREGKIYTSYMGYSRNIERDMEQKINELL